MLDAFAARSLRSVVSVALIGFVVGRASPAQLPITELARVKPADSSLGQCFACSTSVAVSGGIAVVGAGAHGGQFGAAYVFRRGAGGNWIQDAKLVPPDPAFDKGFGYSAAISGSTVVIGAPGDGPIYNGWGAAYVFERGPQGVWTSTVKLLASDGVSLDGFGGSTAIDRDTIVIGAPRHGGVGQSYVFERNAGGPGNWGEVARLTLSGGMPGDRFASTLSLDGGELAIGAPGAEDYPQRPGRVGLFRDFGGAWLQTVEIVTPTGALDQFGFRVALSANSLAVTALMDPTVLPYGAGRAWVFDRNPQTGAWSVAAELLDPTPGGDAYGTSAALDGDTAIVAAANDSDFGQGTGSAHVFSRNTGGTNAWGWVSELHGSIPGAFDYFGATVDLAGGVAVIGAPKGTQSSLIPEWGSAYIFTLDVPSTWSSYCTSGISFAGCTPRMSATGRPSASASTPFSVRVDSAEGQRFGAILYGAKGPSTTPWGTGGTSHLCIQVPVQRTNIQSSGGTALACDGSLSLDWNAFVAAHPTAQGIPFAAGQTLWFQGWLRDIGAPKNSMLSDALAVTLMP